jgi:hypothetical protein
MRSFSVVAVVVAFALSGCANFSSLHRKLNTSEGRGVLVDIKQRAILASTRLENDKDPAAGSHSIVCAEPSPDALSAYAVDLATQASLATGHSFRGGFNSAESSAFVGLRTQSIQLLRDQFFRACEAYLNKAASAGEYNFLIRRYQKQTAALLAIEQLTSMVSAPATTVTAGIESRTALVKSAYDDNQKQKQALEKTLENKALTEAEKNAAKAKLGELESKGTELVLSLRPAEQAKVTGPSADGAKAEPKANEKTAGDVAAVAQVVQHIVDGVISNDDFLQLCIIKYGYLGSEQDKNQGQPEAKEAPADVPRPPRTFQEACLSRMRIENDRFQNENNKQQYENAATAKYVESVIRDSTLTQKQIRDALSIVVTNRTK